MILFVQHLLRMPKPVLCWVGLLFGVNALAIFFLPQIEAWVVLGGLMAGGLLQTVIFRGKGFVRLLGVGHVLWIPMILWLWLRLDEIPSDTTASYWILSVIVMVSLSLVVDAIDFVRYLSGDRTPTVKL